MIFLFISFILLNLSFGGEDSCGAQLLNSYVKDSSYLDFPGGYVMQFPITKPHHYLWTSSLLTPEGSLVAQVIDQQRDSKLDLEARMVLIVEIHEALRKAGIDTGFKGFIRRASFQKKVEEKDSTFPNLPLYQIGFGILTTEFDFAWNFTSGEQPPVFFKSLTPEQIEKAIEELKKIETILNALGVFNESPQFLILKNGQIIPTWLDAYLRPTQPIALSLQSVMNRLRSLK